MALEHRVEATSLTTSVRTCSCWQHFNTTVSKKWDIIVLLLIDTFLDFIRKHEIDSLHYISIFLCRLKRLLRKRFMRAAPRLRMMPCQNTSGWGLVYISVSMLLTIGAGMFSRINSWFNYPVKIHCTLGNLLQAVSCTTKRKTP